MKIGFIFSFDPFNQRYGHILADAALKYTKKKRIPQTVENLEKLIHNPTSGFNKTVNRMISDWESTLSPKELEILSHPVLGGDDPEIWERSQVSIVSTIYARFLQNAQS